MSCAVRTEEAREAVDDPDREGGPAGRAREIQSAAAPIAPLTPYQRGLLIAFAAHVQLNDQGIQLMFHQSDYGFLTGDGRHIAAAEARAFWLLEAAACAIQ